MNNIKYGHRAPKGRRVNRFNYITIEGDLAYCASHNFVYNKELEKHELYNGQACHYTDIRFIDSSFNFYKECDLHRTRWTDITLKTCIRKTLKCHNIPKGTLVTFSKSWYYTDVNVDGSYGFVVENENKLDINYEVNDPSFYNQFTNCEFSKELTNALRENGFLVKVEKNESFLGNMFNQAVAYSGNDDFIDTEIEGDIAFAYGYGKKIGFSSFNNDFMGYSDGKSNILWDFHENFNKWSQTEQINKNTSISEIINILTK